jgi:hypothetical protein
MTYETLNLEQAALFLQVSQGELRKRARTGRVKGVKPAKRWVFLKSDLVDYLDALYADCGETVGGCDEVSLCHYKIGTERGGLTSEVRAEKEYAALLRLQIGR